MADLPTADQAFGQPELPTADQAFPKAPAQGSYSGSVADTLYSISPMARIISAFGNGAKQGWGAGAVQLSKESDDWMKRHGVYNDYTTGNQSFLKGINEAFMRPVIAGAITAGKALSAGMMGLQGATEQSAQELHNLGQSIEDKGFNSWGPEAVVGAGLKTGAEILSGFGQGAGLEIPGMFPHTVTLGRAKAVIGEGESGYFNTRTPKPESLVDRTNAALEIGAAPKPVEPPNFDINSIARQVNPDVWSRIDELKNKQENLRLSRDYLESRLSGDFKADKAIREKMGDIPTTLQEIDEQLRDLIPQQAQSRETVNSLLNSDSKEGAAFRDWVQAQRLQSAIELEDILPEAQDSLAHSEILVPGPLERAESLKEQAAATPVPAQEKPAVGPSEGLPTELGNRATRVSKETVNESQIPTTETNQPTTSPVAAETPAEAGQRLTPIEGAGETKVRGLAANVEASAVERGLAESFGDLPEYQVVKDLDQGNKVADLLNTDLEYAKQIALGQAPAPKGVIPEFVFDAVERHANATGDVDLLLQLGTKSKLLEQATTMGQRLRALGARERLEENPVKMIQAINEARKEKVIKNREANNLVQSAEYASELYKSDFADFIKTLECDY